MEALLGHQVPQAGHGGGEAVRIGRAQHHIGPETLVLEEWVTADLNLGMGGLEIGKSRSGIAFRYIETDRAG